MMALRMVTLAEINLRLSVQVGPTVVVVPEGSVARVAKRLFQRSDRSKVLIEAPATPLELALAMRHARTSSVIVHDFDHFRAEEWRGLDQIRSRLERSPPVVFVLSPSSAERLARHAPNLASWIGAKLRLVEDDPAKTTEGDDVARIFDTLATRWRQETGGLSVTSARYEHPAWKQILSMGPEVVPEILRRIEHQADHWHAALVHLTGENPIPAGERMTVSQVCARWVAWGRERGLLR